MNLNKDKRKVLAQYRLGSVWLGSNLAERDLGVLADNKLNVSEQCAAAAVKANQRLGCTCRGITSRERDVIIALSACQASPGVLCPVPVPTIQERCRQSGEAMKMVKGLEILPYEERLKESGLFFLEKRRLRRNLITVFQYLKGSYQENRGSLFTRSHKEKCPGFGWDRVNFLPILSPIPLGVRRVSEWLGLNHDKKTRVQVALEEVSPHHKKEVFYSENNHSLAQPLQGCGGVPMAGGFRL
ncbi:hypothetical protein QYF61_026987 [Mycteria americana]|uniref:Uncharacterized protein n=1 Tax=Mycteria americana TaxID=33587 RepID=A0AAN7N4K9_MYCAM|nr:hypothetical protein QYF61_026987 [Mycteria americana]